MLWPKKTNEERRAHQRNYRNRNPERILLKGARTRASLQELPFDLEEEDVIIPDVCPYLKVPFVKGTLYAPSIDKIIPELGYVKGNIEVISRKANMMKLNATPEELLEFAYEILERN